VTRVVEINDWSALDNWRLVWSALLPLTRRATFFQTLDWLAAYGRNCPAGERLRALIVYAAGEPIGILPLTLRRQWTRLGPLRVVGYPLDDWGTFFGPIGPNPTATLVAGLGHVARNPRDWDLVELRWVDPDLDAGRTPAAFRAHALAALGQPYSQSAEVDLAAGWDAYWASRTSRWRNNVRRNERLLAARGPVEHLRYRPAGAAEGDADPRWDLLEACLGVAAASWQSGSTTGTTLTHATIAPLVRDAHAAAVRAGGLDLNLLLVAGRPAAFNYAFHYRGHVFGLRTGYDPELAACGPGTVLQARMIEDSCRRGDRTYDLGADYLECKRPWQTRLAASWRYSVFAPRLRPQIVRIKRLLAGR
jgi:CelD/BcsL family acetyltransferase involved in cellulose biosynthesis